MATLTIQNGLYVWAGTFNERTLPKEAGFRWNPDLKRWETRLPEKAYKLLNYATPETRADLEAKMAKMKADLEASAATDSTLVIPVPAGLDYLPYQKGGIAFAQGREGTLIGDEMGLGKTIQAIGIINLDPSIKRALIVCPASLKINWSRELKKWLTRPLTVGIADGKTWPEADIVVINYDVLTKRPEIKAETWDLCVLDESHYIKNGKTGRTKHVVGHRPKQGDPIEPIRARRRVALTGTPILNRPVELFTTLNWLDPATWGSFFTFARRYCGAYQDKYGWHFDGASNLEELQQKLRTSVMVRRLKADVLTELPPKRRQIVEMNSTSAAFKKAQSKILNDLMARFSELRDRAELAAAAGDEAAYQEAVEKLSEGAQVAFEELSEVRHEIAVTKMSACVDFIRDALDSSEKIVVFAHHKDMVDGLMQGLAEFNPVAVTGSTSMVDRQAAVDAFQGDPKVRVFVGNIKAAGVGLTLTAASHVIFCELDFVPGWISQAEDRCHRIGQRDSVLVQHLVLDGTIDAWLAKMLVAKQEIADRALNGGAGIDDTTLDVLDLTERQALIEAKMERVMAPQISPEQVEAVHRNLQRLAGVCDGAAEKDDMGFNAFDARFGHPLAHQDTLTERQALAARKMLTKYRRQLGESAVGAMFSNL